MNKFIKLNQQIGKYRWRICALVFFATTINYLDRNVLGLLKTTLSEQGVFGPDPANQELYYSYVVMAFQLAYAIGLLFAGRFIDWIGTKKGYAYALIGWSLSAIGHAFGHTTLTFGFWRSMLGFTEAGNFPAANKTVAEWFPKKERAFAIGLFNSGANIGAIVAPLVVPWIAIHLGWEWAFVLTGLIGFIWLYFWYTTYDSPQKKLELGKISKAEYDLIHSDVDEKVAEENADKTERVSWFKLLAYRQTWAFFFGKFITDPVWWFILFWLPSFLNSENSSLAQNFLSQNPGYSGPLSQIPGYISWPFAVAVVYTVATFGSIFGGWLPKQLISNGMNANRARKTAMFLFAIFPLTIFFAPTLGNINTWFTVAAISLVCAAHQAWSANVYTTVSDMFPKKTVASVTGIGGMAGAASGILIAWIAGLVLKHYTQIGIVDKGYDILFMFCGLAYLIAWGVMHVLVPKFKPITNL